MTTHDTVPLRHRLDDLRDRAVHDDRALHLTAAGAGVLLGVGDLVLKLSLPYPLADLANSSAAWAAAALLLGWFLRTTPARTATAGVVMLVVAVEAYYVAAILGDLASPFALLAPTTVAWLVMGVLAGAGFGYAGALVRSRDAWVAAAGVALGGAVLLAEAWQRIDQTGTAVLTALLAVALVAGLARDRAVLVRVAALVVPMTMVCHTLFRFAGFGI